MNRFCNSINKVLEVKLLFLYSQEVCQKFNHYIQKFMAVEAFHICFRDRNPLNLSQYFGNYFSYF